MSSPSTSSENSQFTTPASSLASPLLSSTHITPKPKVLLIGDFCGIPKYDNLIREIADVHTMPRCGYTETAALIKQKVEEEGSFVAFGGLFVITDNFPSLWDAGLLSPLLPACRLFVGPGAGYDKVDIPYLSSHGALYANSPHAVGERTADGALGLVLAAARGIVRYDIGVRSGGWRDVGVKSVDWRNAKIGIVGLGAIGLRLSTLLTSLSSTLQIHYHSRHLSSSHLATSYTYHSTLSNLLPVVDILVLTCPLTKATEGIIGEEAFKQMKDGVIVVNVSRGKVIVEDELVKALESGKVLRAALDVFENEPQVHAGLLSNPNVTLSPHVAPAPDSMGPALNAEVLENIIHYLQSPSGLPLTPVNVDQVEALGFTTGARREV
ncbi:oxidoreductase [Cryptococcus wingfieldii CBS 7118]|uniref:Oxidoreductase n=1 Tax=Cryptococcus wingfieldii CBS 7118 TaxID=1295528 RepID=A0A1E3HB97_9TREE|nr:oxidoreductase [Cryptococcus wingfieldii CBS 7118]ODN73607.1 oxidoreductase [Cryptococcus wingfieldii CBS 7118]